MDIRSTNEADRAQFVATLLAAFGTLPETGAGDTDPTWSAFEMDRSLVAEDADGAIVGTAGAYTFELTLPGGIQVPVPGVTAVGVLPSHRRRGILSALMRTQLDGLRAAGESMAVLLASEAVIYRRFGYGPATFAQQLTVQRHRAALHAEPPTGSISVRPRTECGDVLAQVYDAYRRTQVGALSRPAHWWTRGAGRSPVSHAPRLVAVHRDEAGTPDGYACYRVGRVDPVTRARPLDVDELVATDEAAYSALFRFCVEHDLVTEVVFGTLPPDTWLRWLLADHRAAAVTRDLDWLWVRLLDIPRALAARGYTADGHLVLEVADAFCEETAGRYELSVTGGSARCARTDRAADLALDVSDLGSLYLGGATAGALARAGRVRPLSPDAVDRTDALFRSPQTPHTVHWF